MAIWNFGVGVGLLALDFSDSSRWDFCVWVFGVGLMALGFWRWAFGAFGFVALGFLCWAFGVVLLAWGFWRRAFGVVCFGVGLLALGFWHWAFHVVISACGFLAPLFLALIV